VVVIEVHFQGPQSIVVESAAEFDADPLLHVPVSPPGQVQLSEAIGRPLSILHSQFEQFELNGGQHPGSDTVEVEDEIHHPGVLGQLDGIGFGENLVLDEALDKDVGRCAFGDRAVGVVLSMCQSSISSRRLASSSSSGTASSKGISSAWSCVGTTVGGADIGDWSWSVTGIDSGESGRFSGFSGVVLCRENKLGES